MRDGGRKGFTKRKVLHYLQKTIRLLFSRKSLSSYINWIKNSFPQLLAILDLPYHRISVIIKHNLKFVLRDLCLNYELIPVFESSL